MVFLVSGGMSEGARPFPLKMFYEKKAIKLLENTSFIVLTTID